MANFKDGRTLYLASLDLKFKIKGKAKSQVLRLLFKLTYLNLHFCKGLAESKHTQLDAERKKKKEVYPQMATQIQLLHPQERSTFI